MNPPLTLDPARFSRIDPAQEIARLRHSISLLEAYIQPTLRSTVPQRRNSDAASILAPKKEYIDLDVGPDKAAPPGMLGSQVQGGLYAGPTSAATHLLMVRPLIHFRSHPHTPPVE